MHKYNKLRGIVRAKQGSQIPKLYGGNFIPGPGGMMQDGNINRFSMGSQVNTTQADATDFLSSIESQLPSIDFKPQLPENAQQKFYKDTLNTALGKPQPKYSSMANADELLKKTLSEKKFTDTKFGKGVAKAGDFVGNLIMDNSEAIMNGGASIARNSVDIQGEGFSKFDKTTQGIAAFGKQIGGPAGGLISAFATGINTWGNVINTLGARRLQNFSVNKDVQARVGSSYNDSYADITKAGNLANKKVGLFGGAGSKNNFIDDQRIVQGKIARIDAENQNLQAMAGNNLNYLGHQIQQDGGYDQFLMGIRAKQGGILQKINLVKSKRLNKDIINLNTKEIEQVLNVEEFKEGGKIQTEWEPVIEDLWEPVIDIFQKGGKTRTLEELIEYAKKENPRFIQRLSEDPRGINFVDEEGKNAQGSHLLGYELDEEGNAIVFPSIQEMEDGNLKYLSLWDAFDRAIEKKNFLKMTPEEAKLFTESGEDEQGNLFGYKKGWPEFFKKFKKGGTLKEDLETPEIEETNQKNLIPEGALHKNKHHMEHTEGLTQKGIPVIDNDGEQQAEIELDEIIFTLEVTKKLEELYKEGSDEAAIEAGKLLVKEILFNTDDRTGLISKCEKGGKL